MHGHNINLPVCVCVCARVRHTAYRSDPSTDVCKDVPFGGLDDE